MYEDHIVSQFEAKEIDRAILITFTVCDFSLAESMRAKHKKLCIDTFYFVPNYRGVHVCIDEPYPHLRKKNIQKKLSKVFEKMSKKNSIRYFSNRGLEAMEKNYSYKEANDDIMVPSVAPQYIFDEENARNLYRREYFNVFTISRFDFPHKGYVIGLIKAYGKLKEKYPQIRLTIVGYGAGLDRVKETIASLSEEAQKDVYLCGQCAPTELDGYYRDANINVSLAGCFTQGAKRGTLSIPTRHYCYDCETYGFLPKSKDYAVSELPGKPVEPFIEQVINMSEDEYVAYCKASYDAYNSTESKSIEDILESLRNKTDDCLTEKEVNYILRIRKKATKYLYLRQGIRVIKENGLKFFIFNTIPKHLKKASNGQ